MTAAIEVGGNGLVGGIGEGGQWGGRSIHADGGGQDMADEVGGQWGGMSFGYVCQWHQSIPNRQLALSYPFVSP